jgi:tetratricopeptide (TPR) repeat protein
LVASQQREPVGVQLNLIRSRHPVGTVHSRHQGPSPNDLVRLHLGALPVEVVAERERAHLHALCPDCARIRREVLKLRRRQAARDALAAARRPRLEALALEARLAGDREIAEKEVEHLENLLPADRRAAVQRARTRYRTPAFVERLIERSQVWLRHDCKEALALLELAEARLPRIPRTTYGERAVRRVVLRVLAHQGNTLRVAGDLRAAEAKYGEVRGALSAEPLDDDALLGELASLEASLRYDQRRLAEADALLDEAARYFERIGDGSGLVKVLVQRGSIHYASQEFERAIPWYEAAVSAVTFDSHPRVTLSARHNLVLCLCAVGQPQAARELIEESRSLYQSLGDPTTLNLLRWAEGKVAAALGEDAAALERLRGTRDAYAERGLEFDAALVGLDLAEVHLGRGETADVKRIADRMAVALAERGVDREAARAVALLRKAALAEAVTVDLIARTRSALLRVGERPGRRPR